MKNFISKTCLSLALLQGIVFAQKAPAPGAPEPVLVTISKETTRITEPLKPSGYPDYLEALNIAARGKVSPATNGAVLLVRAVGAHDVSPGKQQDEFYKRLGIDPLPETQRRHIFHYDFVLKLKEAELPPPTDEEKKLEYDNEQLDARRARVDLDFEHCGDHPWTAQEYPLVARWLKEQEPSFAQLGERKGVRPLFLDIFTPSR